MKFAEALAKEGVAFIGPPANAIEAMGDKITSKKLAQGSRCQHCARLYGFDRRCR